MKETATQRKRRLEKARQAYRAKMDNEDADCRVKRLSKRRCKKPKNVMAARKKDKDRKSVARANETEEDRASRLASQRERSSQALSIETQEQSASRRAIERDRISLARSIETPEQYAARLAIDGERHSLARSIETPEQSASRLAIERDRISLARSIETPEQHASRLAIDGERHSLARSIETSEQHEERLRGLREAYARRMDSAIDFLREINTFADQFCEVCRKTCYPNQVTKFKRGNSGPPPYLPPELACKPTLILCHRCNTHLKNERNTKAPPKAYWNNLDPGVIPDEIKALTEPEKRMLTRILPYVKVVKIPGRFGQYKCKGQAVLFAYDIFEVTEKLPNMLPRGSDDCGMVVVTETLENKGISRDYTIRRDYIFAALRWLIQNNPLYKDVTINESARMDEGDVVRYIPPEEQQQGGEVQAPQQQQQQSAYMPLNAQRNVSRIVRASWHQGDTRVFDDDSVGRQCFAMATANIVRAAILPPSRWKPVDLNLNMTEADEAYHNIMEFTIIASSIAFPIPPSGYLELRNLDVIADDYVWFGRAVRLQYDEMWLCTGNLNDRLNNDDNEISLTLRNGIERLFEEHSAGVLIASSMSFALLHYDDKYYFTDSHSCGPKGASAENGKACVIECDTMNEFIRIIRRAVGSKDAVYLINYIDVVIEDDQDDAQGVQEEEVQQEANAPPRQVMNATPTDEMEVDEDQEQEYIPMQTTVMAAVDCIPPNIEDEVVEGENLNEIVRKTNNNIVNTSHEKKAEEFCWFSQLPYGKNGQNETREVKISALDYFQSRILGNDSRFQGTDYLFYSLSNFEADRIKANISVHAKYTRVGGQRDGGQVDDLHLQLKNLRGSGAYWRTALSELIAMIRCLGPPTWFITFSCNDLHWLDMRKALLIADNRPNVNPADLSLADTQRLIEKFPVVVSRHFMIRVSALMKLLKNKETYLGGKLKDHWWRIEFQKRGSPHLHMVVWIEGAPQFDTDEGIRFINGIVTCNWPTEDDDPDLYQLVKRNQIHRHTHCCYKNNNTGVCRFAFPRQVCSQTRIVSHTSDEFIRSGGRICVLERKSREKMVNNYCQKILEIWDGNMDIQPCGSDEGIAQYIAKYISKAEPTEMTAGIAQAIRQIRQDPNANISQKLFKACMKILNEREVSACEAVFRLCHLPFRDSSRKCVFLNTRKPNARYARIKFQGNQAADVCSNIIERYEKRPLVHPVYDFANMNLTSFAMHFEAHYKKDTREESVDADAMVEIENEAQDAVATTRGNRLLTLVDNSKMKIRNVPAVVRVPNFIMANDPEAYFYSLLLQFKPFTKESELMEGFDTAREAFMACEDQLRALNNDVDIFRSRMDHLENAFRQAHAFNLLENPEEIQQDEDFEEETNDPGMTDQQFNSACAAMNLKQRELFTVIGHNVQNHLAGLPLDSLKLFVTGGAGVGKTFTFVTLVNLINRLYGKTAVKVCAPTGVAARLIFGSTIHRTFRLPVERNGRPEARLPPLTGNYVKVMRLQWKDIEYLFIDEISMVSYEVFCMIDARLRQLKDKPDVAFGGVNMVVFGDLMQLSPIPPSSPIYKQPSRFQPATHLWRLFSLVELTENMRQRGDTRLADMLNALRVGEMKPEHFQLLMAQTLTEETGEFATNKAVRILPTNDMVSEYNAKVLEEYRAKGNLSIYEITAQDTVVDALRNMDNVDIDNIVSTDPNNTGGLVKKLKIFEGARVMLRYNVNVEKGLVNGAMGVITKIIWPCFRRDQMYDTDIPSVDVDFGGSIGVQRIIPRAVQFPALRNYGTIDRRMLPLILCWACTVHKMQGCTVDHAVVYLGAKLFASGQAYVALSRVRSLEGLRIMELDCSKLTGKTPCNEKALEEIERMRNFRPQSDPGVQ